MIVASASDVLIFVLFPVLVMQGKETCEESSMGDRITVSGNIQNSNLNIKSTLTNVQQSIGTIPGGDDASRAELEGLIVQLNQTLQDIPKSLQDEAEAVAALAQELVEKAKAEKPNKSFLQSSGEGLKKAAENLTAVAPTVLGIASQVVATIMRMKGFM